MPSRRSALFILGSLAAGGLGLVSTGAFSTVEASRTASVGVSGDASALLGITPGASTGNPDDKDYPRYLTGNGENGTIGVDIGKPGKPGVNDNAVTAIDQLLEVTNNGTEKVIVGFVAEYAADVEEDFSGDVEEVLPYGYTFATNDAEDVALVMWASPKESRMDNTYAEVRPELNSTGFGFPSESSLVDGGSIRDEIAQTIDDDDDNPREITPGQSVNIGLVIDTRDETINQNGEIPEELDKNISLVAERTENIE